jgi:Ribbon-helix-helix protein, copG family
MTLKSVVVQLSEDQIDRLDRIAAHTGASRSQVVRDAIDDALTPPIDSDVAARYAAAYPDNDVIVDKWGDLDQSHSAAARERASDERDPW